MKESEGSVLLLIRLLDGVFDEDAIINIGLNTINETANSKQNHKFSIILTVLHFSFGFYK